MLDLAEKDLSEKLFEDYPDVFADIVNTLLFDGKDIIAANDLEDMRHLSAYQSTGGLRSQERDVAKRWKKNGVQIACIGLENQSEPDRDMVLRVFSYDGAEYRSQCLRENTANPRYPVLTLVLYFGHKKRWTAPKTLYECLEVPEELKPFIENRGINLFEIAWLSDEQVSKFKSDFRILANYFVQKRKMEIYKGTTEEIQHVESLLQLLSVLENDRRFEDVYIEEKEKGGIHNMCEVLDRVEAIGKEKGLQEGIKKGKENNQIANIFSLMATMNLSPQQAMDALRIPTGEQLMLAEKIKI